MLSRGSRDGERRVRLTKSQSLDQQRVQPTSTTGEEEIAHKHAVAAATTAFERAHGFLQGKSSNKRHGVLRKKKGRESSEGSHLSNCRDAFASPDRRDGRKSRIQRQQADSNADVTVASQHDASTTRAHDILDVEAQISKHHTAEELHSSIPSSYRKLRKSPSGYSPRSAKQETPLNHRSFDIPVSRRSKAASIYNEDAPPASEPIQGINDHTKASTPANPDIKSTEDALSTVGEEPLPGIYKKRVKKRPSLLLGPFKRAGKDLQVDTLPKTSVTYDNEKPSDRRESATRAEGKPRSISNSLKTRVMGLRGFFRKSSNTSNGLPVQHIEASRLHFETGIGHSSLESDTRDSFTSLADDKITRNPSRVPSAQAFLDEGQLPSRVSSSSHSEGNLSNAKSRVTSWTNSTAGNTVSSKRLSVIGEDVAPAESISSHRHGSFSESGSAIIERTARRVSSANQRLPSFSRRNLVSPLARNALLAERYGEDDGQQSYEGSVRKPSIYDTLPSQVQRNIEPTFEHRMQRSTIRPVSPDQFPFTMSGIRIPAFAPQFDLPDIPPSKEPPVDSTLSNIGFKSSQDDSVGTTDAPALYNDNMYVPSPQQIAGRLERSNDRWKTSLDEMAAREVHSPFSPTFQDASRLTGYINDRENLSRNRRWNNEVKNHTPIQPGKGNSIINRVPQILGNDAITNSPSVYSRDTDSASPNRNDSAVSVSDAESTGTAVIKIGKLRSTPIPLEARAEVDDQRHSDYFNTEWRDRPARDSPEPLSGAASRLHDQIQPSKLTGHRREHAQIVASEGSTATQITSTREYSPTLSLGAKRPPITVRQHSRMNERFPILETGTQAQKQPVSRQEDSLSVRTSLQKTSTNENEINPARRAYGQLSRPKSMMSMDAARRRGPGVVQYTTSVIENQGKEIRNARGTNNFRFSSAQMIHRPKSALELKNQPPSPISYNVRRKPVPGSPLDENTLKDIINGPYASPATPSPKYAKENSRVSVPRSVGSATREGTPDTGIGNSTPTGGQRMADIFLSNRRNGENSRYTSESPAFL